MTTAKQEVFKLLENLSEDNTLEDIQYHLYVLQKVEHGMADIQEGRTFTREEVERRMAKWLKK